MRQQVTLYKNDEALAVRPLHSAAQHTENAAMEGGSDDDGDSEGVDAAALDIPLEELLDDLEALNMDAEA